MSKKRKKKSHEKQKRASRWTRVRTYSVKILTFCARKIGHGVQSPLTPQKKGAENSTKTTTCGKGNVIMPQSKKPQHRTGKSTGGELKVPTRRVFQIPEGRACKKKSSRTARK